MIAEELIDRGAHKYWVLGMESLIDEIVAEAFSCRDYVSLDDDELAGLAKLQSAVYSNRVALGRDACELDPELEECFTELWLRFCRGEGDAVVQFEGIKSVYDASPTGLDSFEGQMAQAEKSMFEALRRLSARCPELECAAMKLASSALLDDDRSGAAEFLRHGLTRWMGELREDGSWPGIPTEEAFRRISLLGRAYRHSALSDIDCRSVAAVAFRHYAAQIIDPNGCMQNATFEALEAFSDSYFGLPDRENAGIMPAHLVSYCMAGLDDDTLAQRQRHILHRIVLMAYLRQQEMLPCRNRQDILPRGQRRQTMLPQAPHPAPHYELN